MLRISDCIADSILPAIPKPTKRQRLGNQIDAATIFAGTDFVNVLEASHRTGQRLAPAID
jgi:hypothetical protein